MPGHTDTEVNARSLVFAVKEGRVDVCKRLLEAGADPNSTDASGNPVLYIAVQGNNPDICLLLCTSGAQVNLTGLTGSTSLHWAAKKGLDDCVEALIKQGANLDLKDTSGSSPLTLAVRHKQYGAIRQLLHAGCDVNIADKDGRTALHFGSHTAVAVESLIRAGGDVNARDRHNCTPLLMAASEGLDGPVSVLCQVPGCDVNIANSTALKTPLHILAGKGHIRGVKSLLSTGADVNLLDSERKSALSYAVVKGKCNVIAAILKDPQLKDSCQQDGDLIPDVCPVALAASKRRLDILKLFIVCGYDRQRVRTTLADPELQEVFKHEEMSDWLSVCLTVPTLSQICRKVLRHHFGSRLPEALSDLSLPGKMCKYLTLSELDDL